MAKNKYLKKELQMKALSIALATSLSASNTGIVTALGQEFDGADNVNQDSLLEENTELEDGDVEAELEDGDVEAELEDGDVEAELEDGDVEAELEDSDINTELEDGDVEAELEDGDVEAELEDGDVEAELEDSDVEAELEDSDINTELEDSDINTELEDGDVEAELENGDVEAELEDGDVEAELEDGDVEVELEDGDVEVELEEESLIVPKNASTPTTYDSNITVNMGSITTAMKPGTYDIPANFTGGNSVSSALSGETVSLEITNEGKAFVTVEFQDWSHLGFNRYLSAVNSNNQDIDEYISLSTVQDGEAITSATFEIANIEQDTLEFTYSAKPYSNSFLATTLSSQTATLNMDFSEYEVFPEFGSSKTQLSAGKYSVDVSFDSVNSASGALNGETGELEVAENGDAFITIGLGLYWNGISQRYIGDIVLNDGGAVEILEGTEVKPTKVKFEITDISSDDIALTHNSYVSYNNSQSNENQKGTLTIDYTKTSVIPDDLEAPEITIEGYTSGESHIVEMSDIDELTSPTAVVTDNVDEGLSAGLVITESDNTTTLADFDVAKAYLKTTAGNSITLTYTATDNTGNSSTFTITFVSRNNRIEELEDGNVYGASTTLGHASTEGSLSSVDGSLDSENGGNRISRISVENGVYTIDVELGTTTKMGITSGLADIISYDGNMYDIQQIPSSDGSYTEKLRFKTDEQLDYYMIQFKSDYGFMISTHEARLTFDWDVDFYDNSNYDESIWDNIPVESPKEEETPDEELEEDVDITEDGEYSVPLDFVDAEGEVIEGTFGDIEDVKITTESGKYEIVIEFDPTTTSITDILTSNNSNISDIIILETIRVPKSNTSPVSISTTSDEDDYIEYITKFSFKTTDLEEEPNLDFTYMLENGTEETTTVALSFDVENANNYNNDNEAPKITIDGYTSGESVTVEMSDIDDLVLPTATVTDNVDEGLNANLVITGSDDTTTLADFDAAKAYLKTTIGNSVTLTYTATDIAGNSNTFTIIFTSKEDASGDNSEELTDGVYGAYTELYQSNGSSLSAVDGALNPENGGNRTSKISVENGVYTIEVELGTAGMFGMTSGLANITSHDGEIYEIQQTLSDDGSYTEKLSFKTDKQLDYYMIEFDVDYGNNEIHTYQGRLTFDWANLSTYPDDSIDIQQEGTFEVPIAMHKETNDDASMGDPVFNDNRITNVYNMGDYYIFEAEMTPMEFSGVTMGVGGIRSTDSDIEELVYETAVSEDITAGSKEYVSKVLFKTDTIKDYYSIDMDLAEHNNTDARLYFEWSELEKISSDNTNAPSLDDYKDTTPPVIEVSGYTSGESHIVEISNINDLVLPTATATDNVDGDLSADLVITGSDDTTLADFDATKAYLKTTIGNSVTLTYTATDRAGNTSDTFTIIFTSKADANGDNSEELTDGVYGASTTLGHATTEGSLSGVDGSLDSENGGNRISRISLENGVYTIDVELGTTTKVGITSGLADITSYDGNIYDIQQVLSSDGSYTEKLRFKTDEQLDYYMIQFKSDYGFMVMTHEARLTFDWANLSEYSNDNYDGSIWDADIEEEGTFEVPIAMHKETSNDASMGDPVFNNNRITNVYNMGDYYIFEAEMTPMTFAGLTMGVGGIRSTDSDIEELVYETAISEDITAGSKEYVSKVLFKTDTIKDYYSIDMDLAEHNNTDARLYFEWDSLLKTSTGTTNAPSLDDYKDTTPPVIEVSGHTDGDTKELYISDVDDLLLPAVTVTDDFDKIIEADVEFKTSTGTTLADFSKAKEYLKEIDGNSITITYTATDRAGNTSDTFTIIFTSKADLEFGADIKDSGTFEVPIAMHKETSNDTSMGDGVFEGNRITNVYNMGSYYIFEAEMTPMTFAGLTMGVEGIRSTDSAIDKLLYKTDTSEDITSGSQEYVSKVYFTTHEIKDYYSIDMDLAEHNNTDARLYFDWSKLKKTSSSTTNAPDLDDLFGDDEDYTDATPPEISISGYSNGQEAKVYTSKLSTLSLPTANVTDNVDGKLEAIITITSATTGNTFSTFDTAKEYLKTGGNKVIVEYKAVDTAGNYNIFTINFTSIADIIVEEDNNDNGEVDITKNGVYGVETYLYHATKDQPSMGDGALSSTRTSIITNNDGTYSFEVSLGTVSVASLTGGISDVKSIDGKLTNITYTMATDSNGNLLVDDSGSNYIEKLYFEATEMPEFYEIEMYIPVMEEFGIQEARLTFDWDNVTLIPSDDQEEEEEEETFYFTFGGEKENSTLIPDGDHKIEVGINTNNTTELGEVVEKVLSDAGTLTVDRKGDGKLTLRFADKVKIGDKEYTVKGFRYRNPSAISIFNVSPILSNNGVNTDENTNEVTFDILDPTAKSLDVILEVESTDENGVTTESDIDVEITLGYDNVEDSTGYDDTLVTDREEEDDSNSDGDGGTTTPPTTTPPTTTPPTDGDDNSSDDNTSNDIDIKDNGNYTVDTYLYHESKDQVSMGDGALSNSRTSKITNNNGTYSFEISLGTVEYSGLTGGIGSIKSTDGKLTNITYDMGTDSNGNEYVKKLYFKTKDISDFYDIEMYIPVMEEFGDQDARLKFDWDTLKKSSSGASSGSTSTGSSGGGGSSSSSTTESTEEESTENLLEEVDMTVNGTYLVPLALMHESKDQVSMGNGAFETNKYAIVNTQDGTYTVLVQPSTITISSLTSGIGTLISTDGAMNALTILERQKLETGDEYISKFQFTTTKFDEEYPIQITVPNSPMGVTDARLVLNWDNAIKGNGLTSGSSINNAQLLSLLEVSKTTNLPLVVQDDESGVSINFDAEALQTILELAGEEELVINVKEMTSSNNTLTQAQQDTLSTDAKLYHFEILIGEEALTSLDSGKITIELPYTLYAGQEEEALTVSHIGEDGEVKEFDFTYDYKNITFETSTFGLYAVDYNEIDTTTSEEQLGSNELDLDSVVLEFGDVSSSDWFYDYVKYTYARGIFKGTSDTTFDPYSNATREAFVTVLYRLAGEPSINTRNEFTDVLSEQYYTDAVIWASENSIVSGYGNNKFGTGDSITREQMVTIIYNFANHMGIDTSTDKDLTSFSDASQISDYALDAFKWAVAEEIISGNGNGTVTPKNTATRSEISKILTVLAQNYGL